MKQEDFVTFEIAQKLKEKGFDEECYTFYEYASKEFYREERIPCCNSRSDDYAAPTISQVLKWLREKHATHIEISLGGNGWYFEIIQYEYNEEEKEYYCKLITISVINDSYEQAAIAGIEYVLDNLI